ncbi:MAG: hypothetical protein AAF658_17785, partial [Myxococcota bacterium]
RVALREILDAEFAGHRGMAARAAQHTHAARAMRAAWDSMGLDHLAPDPLRGVTLCALKVPAGVSAPVPPAVKARGVTVAGGLYPGLQKTYFRVGHMGYCITQPEMLETTVRAVAGALRELGASGADEDAAAAAFRETYGATSEAAAG